LQIIIHFVVQLGNMAFALVLPSVAFVATALGAVGAKVEILPMKHDIQQIQASNFDTVIGKFRDGAVSSLWFFHEDSKQDASFLDEYNKVASDLKGMAKVCAISCTDFPVFCKKNDIKETPTVMIYPTNPIPAFAFQGKMESKPIAGKISKLLPDLSVKVTAENADTFVTTEPSKPKVLLFSDKKISPTHLESFVQRDCVQADCEIWFCYQGER
jgi:hypothetical protein